MTLNKEQISKDGDLFDAAMTQCVRYHRDIGHTNPTYVIDIDSISDDFNWRDGVHGLFISYVWLDSNRRRQVGIVVRDSHNHPKELSILLSHIRDRKINEILN